MSVKVEYIHRPVEQLSTEWHRWRHMRITASVAAACIGMHPHTSPQEAYRMIRGEVEHVSDWFVKHGREHEPTAVALYEQETGQTCGLSGFWERSDCPWLGASPDRLVQGGGLLEVKCGKTEQTSLPLHWRIQATVQLACTGQPWCDVAWFRDGQIKVWRVLPVGVEATIHRLRHFYYTHVLPGVVPPRGSIKRWV